MFLHFLKKCLFVADIVIYYIALEDYKPHPWFDIIFLWSFNKFIK